MSMMCCGGQCVDTAKDVQNCGACNTACGSQHSTATCKSGACVAGACSAGWGDCNSDPKDGCETSFHNDPINCGACGKSCVAANAIPGCADGCYIRACVFGFEFLVLVE